MADEIAMPGLGVAPPTARSVQSALAPPFVLGAGGVPAPSPKAAVLRDRAHKLRAAPKPEAVPSPPKVPFHRPRVCAPDKDGWCIVKSRKQGMRRGVYLEALLPEGPANTCEREFDWYPVTGHPRLLKQWATVRKSALVGTTKGMAVVVFPYPSSSEV